MEDLQTRDISVLRPVGFAIEKTREILFSPFDMGKWFTIGFCAWLAFLGESGGGSGGGRGGRPNIHLKEQLSEVRNYIAANMSWLIPAALVALVIFSVIAIVLIWLRSRGKFMFLFCVARNEAQVVYPWTEYAREGNSLFLFKLCVGLISAICFIPLAIGWFIVVLPLIQSERLIIAAAGPLVFLSLATLAVTIIFGVISVFTEHFVVPVMYLYRISCMEGWRRFRILLNSNVWRFIGYLFFILLISLCIVAIIFAAVIFTCCCFACVSLIPYIGTVLILPLLVFLRAYSAFYLAQYGPEWDVFARSSNHPSFVNAAPINPDNFYRGNEQTPSGDNT